MFYRLWKLLEFKYINFQIILNRILIAYDKKIAKIFFTVI